MQNYTLLSTYLNNPPKGQRSRDTTGRTLGSDETPRGALETRAQQKQSKIHEHSEQPIKTNAGQQEGEVEHPISHYKLKDLYNNSPQENGQAGEGVTPSASDSQLGKAHHDHLSPHSSDLNPSLPSHPPIK